MNICDFPLELKEIILFSIYDKKTILRSRLVCYDWYLILRNFKEYFDYGVVIQHFFEKEKYICKNIKLNLILKELKFGLYGKYIYTEYCSNRGMVKKVESFPPFKLILTEYNYAITTVKEYDIRRDNIKKITLNNYLMNGPCVIS